MCRRWVAEPGTVGAEDEGDAAVGEDEDEDRWVVEGKRWQWGRD